MMNKDNTAINLEILFKLVSELQHRVRLLEEAQEGKQKIPTQMTAQAYINTYLETD